MIRLYHGTNLAIEKIDLSVCRPNKDFGKGFYLTQIEEQAEKMARRVAAIYGGLPVVNCYCFDDTAVSPQTVRVRRFDSPSVEWALFIANNRNGLTEGDNNLDNKYDIVIGPVANDDLSLLFRQFMRGYIDLESLAKGLQYKKLNDQFSFHTEQAVSLLTKEGERYV